MKTISEYRTPIYVTTHNTNLGISTYKMFHTFFGFNVQLFLIISKCKSEHADTPMSCSVMVSSNPPKQHQIIITALVMGKV